MSRRIKKFIRSPIGRIAGIVAAPVLGPAVGAGLGLTGATAATVGGGLVGAGLGAAGGGGLKSALIGGATGAAGGALTSGGLKIPGLGSTAGTPLSGGLQGPTQGTGVLGAVSRGASNLSNTLRGAIGLGGTGTAGSGGSLISGRNLLSAANSYMTQEDLEDQLVESQRRADAAVRPFSAAGQAATSQLSNRLTSGFNPGDLTQDPGYQFRLQEGQRQLDRSLAAQGMSGSGRALRAAQEFGQGLADQTYNDAYSRWLQQNSQLGSLSGTGLGAATTRADISQNIGNTRANATLAQSNALTQALSGVGQRRIIGFDQRGNPIYDTER